MSVLLDRRCDLGRTALVTTTGLSETVAYQITRALFENFDDFRRLHPDI